MPTKFWVAMVLGLIAVFLLACAGGAQTAPVQGSVVTATSSPATDTPGAGVPVTETPIAEAATSSTDVVVYAADLAEDTLTELEFWDDSAAPGGKLIGITNNGDELDPPPENDPHVTIRAMVQGNVAYRCWIHMKVGEPKGKSQANKLWVQFSGAVDKANKPVFQLDTASYLTASGPTHLGWAWVACDLEDASPADSLVKFGATGEVTVRIQAGMEGVGFDQFLLSPAQFLEQPPAEAVVKR